MTSLKRPPLRAGPPSLRRRLAVAWSLAALAAAFVLSGGVRPAQAEATVSVAAAARTKDSFAPNDPWEKMNRRFYALNRVIDHTLLRPLALGYSHNTPKIVQRLLHNFVTNISEPLVFMNDVVQLKPKRAMRTFARFATNSLIGIGGLFDPATGLGVPHRDNGFGDTLGRYGVGPGPYIYLPVVGPSTVRDLFGTGVDVVTQPIGFIQYHGDTGVLLGTFFVGGLDERAAAEPDLQAIESMGTDSYATLRSFYLQNRQSEITGGVVKIEDLPDFGDTPQAAPTDPAAEAQPAAAPATPSEIVSAPATAGAPAAAAPLSPPAPLPNSPPAAPAGT